MTHAKVSALTLLAAGLAAAWGGTGHYLLALVFAIVALVGVTLCARL